MFTRNDTKKTYVGGVPIGGGSPVVIESMTNTDTRDVAATIRQIHLLEAAGCEIVRLAVLDSEAALALREIKAEINIPMIADIHFDYKLALAAVKSGVDKLRINPGNIGAGSNVREVAEAAKVAGIPIRVGVNAGSISRADRDKYGGVTPEAMAESAFYDIDLLEKHNFDNIVISLKASNLPLMLEANKIVAGRVNYPLHIGLTESGTPVNGAIRSAAALGSMLILGLGDTIRVSLSGDPVEEIKAAKLILSAMGLREFGVRVIACPTCGRTTMDVPKIAEMVEKFTENIKKPLTVAVMGCVVNGPGEAREADIGMAGADSGNAAIYKDDKVIARGPVAEMQEFLLNEIQKMAEEE